MIKRLSDICRLHCFPMYREPRGPCMRFRETHQPLTPVIGRLICRWSNFSCPFKVTIFLFFFFFFLVDAAFLLFFFSFLFFFHVHASNRDERNFRVTVVTNNLIAISANRCWDSLLSIPYFFFFFFFLSD